MTQTPARDFIHPRLVALFADGATAGFGRDVVMAVLLDLLDKPEFDVPTIADPDPAAVEIGAPPAAGGDNAPYEHADESTPLLGGPDPMPVKRSTIRGDGF